MFTSHAVEHHTQYRKVFHDDPMPKGEDRGIRLNFWEGLVEGLPVALILLVFSPVGAGMFMLVVAIHHTIWNQIHLEMHQPTKRFFANWSLYKFCARHHFLHHKYPDKNFNVALPIGDYFVMNAHTIKGEATIRKEDGTKYKKDVDNAHIYVSWITDGDKTQEWEDPGYHAGATAGHVACKYGTIDEVYMIGMDLRSDTKMYNNMYKGTKNYSSAHYEPSPTGIWEAEWLRVLKDNPNVSFYKVNKADDDNTTNQKLLGNEKNLTYITQAQLLDNMSK